MKEVAEYRRYAEICERLGREASDPLAKRQLLEMSTVWALLADERNHQLSRRKGASGPA